MTPHSQPIALTACYSLLRFHPSSSACPSDSGWDSCNEEYSEEEQGFILIEKPESEDRKNDNEKEEKEKDTDSSRDKNDKKGKAEDKEKKDKGITKKRGVPDGHNSSSNSRSGHKGSEYCTVVDEAPQTAAEGPPFPANSQAHVTTKVDDLTKPPAPSPDYQQVDIDTKSSPKPLTAPASTVEATPPSGYRLSLRTDSGTPPPNQTGPPVTYDVGGISPLFVGSAFFKNSVHPCKIGYHLQPPVCIPYDGREYCHDGHYDLLPFIPDQMEWIPTSGGHIPPGRRAIEGGHEEKGDKLYHALANMNGLVVPGKTGEHLGSAKVPFDGKELTFEEYRILCWK